MSGCKPEEGIFPPDGNTLTFDQDGMHIVISCQPVAGDRCILTVTFKSDIMTRSVTSPIQGQPCSKLGLAQAWEPFRDQILQWSATQDSVVADNARRLMAKALSKFLHLGIDIPL